MRRLLLALVALVALASPAGAAFDAAFLEAQVLEAMPGLEGRASIEVTEAAAGDVLGWAEIAIAFPPHEGGGLFTFYGPTDAVRGRPCVLELWSRLRPTRHLERAPFGAWPTRSCWR